LELDCASNIRGHNTCFSSHVQGANPYAELLSAAESLGRRKSEALSVRVGFGRDELPLVRLFEDAEARMSRANLYRLISEVLEIQCHPKIFPSQELDHGLQIILLLSGDPDLAILKLALDI
jgi:hypothetical protein